MKQLAIALVAAIAMSAFSCKHEDKKAEPAEPAEPAAKPAEPAEPAAKPADPAPPADGSDIPAACMDYAKKMEKCLQSDRFPAAAKEQTKQAFETMKSGWANLGAMPPDARANAIKSAADACTQAMVGMKQAGESMCPGVFWPSPIPAVHRDHAQAHGYRGPTDFGDVVALHARISTHQGELRLS